MRTHKLFKVLVLGGAVLASGCGGSDPNGPTSTSGSTGAGGGKVSTLPDGGATGPTSGRGDPGGGVPGW